MSETARPERYSAVGTGTRHGVIVCLTWTSSQISKVCTICIECVASGGGSAGIKTRGGSCTAGGCAGAGADGAYAGVILGA